MSGDDEGKGNFRPGTQRGRRPGSLPGGGARGHCRTAGGRPSLPRRDRCLGGRHQCRLARIDARLLPAGDARHRRRRASKCTGSSIPNRFTSTCRKSSISRASRRTSMSDSKTRGRSGKRSRIFCRREGVCMRYREAPGYAFRTGAASWGVPSGRKSGHTAVREVKHEGPSSI